MADPDFRPSALFFSQLYYCHLFNYLLVSFLFMMNPGLNQKDVAARTDAGSYERGRRTACLS